MIWIYALSLLFVFVYIWGGNTNGTWSPKILFLGAFGFIATFILSTWISFLDKSWLWVHILWSSLLVGFILTYIFTKVFKRSWVDNVDFSEQDPSKIIKKLREGKD